MLKKTIHYTDFNGEEQSEDFYFNLSRAELIKLEMDELDEKGEGGLTSRLELVSKSGNGREIMQVFDDILRWSYGIRTPDGKRFIKSDANYAAFKETAAFDEFFMSLVTDAGAASEFITGLIPDTLIQDAQKTAAEQVRERSQAALQGHKQKAEHEGSIITEVVEPEQSEDLSSLTKEELIQRLGSR